MTFEDRRGQLAERLQQCRAEQIRFQDGLGQLTRQIDQLIGALGLLDQLIAEKGTDHASGLQSAATSDGHEVRPGETSEERQG